MGYAVIAVINRDTRVPTAVTNTEFLNPFIINGCTIICLYTAMLKSVRYQVITVNRIPLRVHSRNTLKHTREGIA